MSMTVLLEKFNRRGKIHSEDLWAGVLDSIGEKRRGTPPSSSVLLAVDEMEPTSSHFRSHSRGHSRCQHFFSHAGLYLQTVTHKEPFLF